MPERIDRQRARLQDAMVDTHFMTGFIASPSPPTPTCCALGDPPASGVGAQVVAAVAPVRAGSLPTCPAPTVKIGDLETLNAPPPTGRHSCSSPIPMAHRVQRAWHPLLRAGSNTTGRRLHLTWAGYRGARQALF